MKKYLLKITKILHTIEAETREEAMTQAADYLDAHPAWRAGSPSPQIVLLSPCEHALTHRYDGLCSDCGEKVED